MAVTELSQRDMFTLTDHYENTRDKLVKCYTMRQLMAMEGKDRDTIARRWIAIPVRVDEWNKCFKFKIWQSTKPYQIRWIRIDEVAHILSMATWKIVNIELKNELPTVKY